MIPHIPVGSNLLLSIPTVEDTIPLEGENGRIITLHKPMLATANERAENHKGIIVKIGARVDPEFAINDDVTYNQHSATKVRWEGFDYAIVDSANIILRIPFDAQALQTTEDAR